MINKLWQALTVSVLLVGLFAAAGFVALQGAPIVRAEQLPVCKQQCPEGFHCVEIGKPKSNGIPLP